MSSKKEAIEEVAAERPTPQKYDADLNPGYPKFVAECECNWSASDFGEDRRGGVMSVAEGHEDAQRYDVCEVTVTRINEDGDSEVIR